VSIGEQADENDQPAGGPVSISGADGFQIGNHNVQNNNYYYGQEAWSSGPPEARASYRGIRLARKAARYRWWPHWRRGLAAIALVAAVATAGAAWHLISISRPAGGQGSPQAAVTGFFDDLVRGDSGGACSYEMPGSLYTCAPDALPGGGSVTGSLSAGTPAISGALALVPVTGQLCTNGQCQEFESQQRDSAGLPPGLIFQDLYTQAQTLGGGDNFVPCEEVGGKWYVTLNG
jgi:hypothetical protein